MGLNLLIKPLYIFGIDIRVQNVVGAGDYGLFFSIFNFSMLFQIVLELGLNNLIRRDIAENKQLTRRYFSRLMGLKLVLLPIYVILSVILACLVGYGREQFSILIYTLLIQIGLSFILFVRAILAGLGKFKWDSLLSVIDKLFMIIICGWLLYLHPLHTFTIHTFIYCYLIAIGGALLIGFGVLLLKFKHFRIRIDIPHLRFFIRRTFPYALITFLMIMYGRMDSVYLERLLTDGDYQAGIYAAGFRLLDAYLMFAVLFSNLVLPMMAAISKDKLAKMDFFHFAFNILMVPTVIFGLSGWFFNSEITAMLYQQSDTAWTQTLGVLLLTSIPLGIGIITGSGILSSGKLKQLNILYAVNIGINLLLNLILIPRFLSLGAAVSAFSVNLVAAMVQYYLTYQVFGLKTQWKNLRQISIFIAINVFLLWGLNVILPDLSWLLKLIIYTALAIVVAWRMKILPLENIRQIWYSKIKESK